MSKQSSTMKGDKKEIYKLSERQKEAILHIGIGSSFVAYNSYLHKATVKSLIKRGIAIKFDRNMRVVLSKRGLKIFSTLNNQS